MNDNRTNKFPSGKLPAGFLDRMLNMFSSDDPSIFLGPEIGCDAAVLDLGERFLIIASDPITFTADDPGWYSVCINSNDIAVMGAIPRWFTATILLPETCADEDSVRNIFTDLKNACEEFGISLVGGHTEITPAVEQPVISGTMLGEAKKDELVTPVGGNPGDAIIMTSGAGIEGSAILASECSQKLIEAASEDNLKKASGFIRNPGIGILRHARIAIESGKVTAMHDATEGGIATALSELALASKTGLTVERNRIIILPETEIICRALDLDPLGLLSSGCLLIACVPEDAENIAHSLEKENIAASIIGRLQAKEEKFSIITKKGKEYLPVFQRDELARYYSRKKS